MSFKARDAEEKAAAAEAAKAEELARIAAEAKVSYCLLPYLEY